MNNVETAKRAKYGLARSWIRILARTIDFIIIYGIIFGIGFFILWTDKEVSNFNDIKNFSFVETWRYLLITIVYFLLMFGYFVCLPLVWKGKTIGKWMFKLSTWNLIPTKSFFLNLIKKEFFIWIILGIINLILGFVLLSMDKEGAGNLIKQILNVSNENSGGEIGIFFQTLYYGYGLILFGIIIYMVIRDKKRCFQDKISDTVVIKMVDISSDENNENKNIKQKISQNYGLPGEIKSGVFDEVDSL